MKNLKKYWFGFVIVAVFLGLALVVVKPFKKDKHETKINSDSVRALPTSKKWEIIGSDFREELNKK